MADPKYNMNDLMAEILGMKKEVESMRSELENAKLRAENAELKLASRKAPPSEKDYPPLRQGKNQSNDWLNEMINYNVPFDPSTKEDNIDVIINGKFFRIRTGEYVKMPRYVAIVLQQRLDDERDARREARRLSQRFEDQANKGFKDTVNPPPRS